MSTPALTSFATHQWLNGLESDTKPDEVGHFWRKFDGAPVVHVKDLQKLIGKEKYENLWELFQAVVKIGLTVKGENFNWAFLPVNPSMDLNPLYKYVISLVDEKGELPREIGGAYDVHLVVNEVDIGTNKERELYNGLLRDCKPGKLKTT